MEEKNSPRPNVFPLSGFMHCVPSVGRVSTWLACTCYFFAHMNILSDSLHDTSVLGGCDSLECQGVRIKAKLSVYYWPGKRFHLRNLDYNDFPFFWSTHLLIFSWKRIEIRRSQRTQWIFGAKEERTNLLERKKGRCTLSQHQSSPLFSEANWAHVAIEGTI